MLRSMTGYGRGEYVLNNRKMIVELKSVNHRYSDINIKLPKIMNLFEDRIRKKLSSQVQRGKVDVYILMDTFSTDDIKINLNEALAEAYIVNLKAINERFCLNDEIKLDLITRFPDIITVDRNIDDEKVLNEIWDTLEKALDLAIAQFIQMRSLEGKVLKENILIKLASINNLTDKIKLREPFIVEEYRDKIKNKMKEILENVTVDENRLLTEVALFADRSSIDEEITRLQSHITQLTSILEQNDSIGRKLDFIVQEMNREVNTIGSKSNDLEVTKIVVELKSEIEKIREQIQNIE